MPNRELGWRVWPLAVVLFAFAACMARGVPMSVLIRRLSITEVHRRQRARSDAEVARHNAGVVESLGQRTPRRRDQVLDEFDPMTRRMAR